VCTNHITETEWKWERDRIIIILQWMNGYGIPHPLSARHKLRVGLPQHTALAWWGGPEGCWWRNGRWQELPGPPYPPVPALIYTLATTKTEIANWPFSVNWISQQTHDYYYYYCRPVSSSQFQYFFLKGKLKIKFPLFFKGKQALL